MINHYELKIAKLLKAFEYAEEQGNVELKVTYFRDGIKLGTYSNLDDLIKRMMQKVVYLKKGDRVKYIPTGETGTVKTIHPVNNGLLWVHYDKQHKTADAQLTSICDLEKILPIK